jgi:hypothetical protein
MKLHSNSRTRSTPIGGRLCPLAACLAVALSSGASATGNHVHGRALVPAIHGNGVAHFAHPSAATSAVTHVVSTCDDPLPLPSTCAESTVGTLRQGFLCAQNGDMIDLTQLVCSKITLSAPLVAGPGTLTLNGPGQDELTIDAAGQFQALVHNAGPDDGLYVNDLTVANGHYDNPPARRGGGCISSTGKVFLNNSTVSSCYVSSSARAYGGGIFTFLGTVSLNHSSVTGNTAHSSGDGGYAAGGGIVASYLELNRSAVSGNTASYTGTGRAVGGGVVAFTVHANYSTISGNGAATAYAGIYTANAYLFNSTVSGNHADNGPVGGVYAFFGAQIFNSTITANTSKGAVAAGLFSGFATSPSSILQSTIIANNSASGAELDLGSVLGPVLGSNNLIMAHPGITVPADTISADPKLGPLQDNGGPTRTHALLPDSPAIDNGLTAEGDLFDQRGFSRVVGSDPDIGAVEFDPDRIFGNGFNL